MNDFFKNEKKIDYDQVEEKDKKYFMVPIKLSSSSQVEGVLEYKLDLSLLEKVEKLKIHGYRRVQKGVLDILASNKLKDKN